MPLIHKILVPTDFSEHARHAVDHGADLAALTRSPLVLVHVYARPVVYMPDTVVWMPPPDEREIRAAIDDGMAKLEAQARAAGAAEVTRILREGDAAHEIIAAAIEQGVDLIVMGSHGRGGVSRVLLGSVAEKVIRKAPCAVLVVGPRAPA